MGPSWCFWKTAWDGQLGWVILGSQGPGVQRLEETAEHLRGPATPHSEPAKPLQSLAWAQCPGGSRGDHGCRTPPNPKRHSSESGALGSGSACLPGCCTGVQARVQGRVCCPWKLGLRGAGSLMKTRDPPSKASGNVGTTPAGGALSLPCPWSQPPPGVLGGWGSSLASAAPFLPSPRILFLPLSKPLEIYFFAKNLSLVFRNVGLGRDSEPPGLGPELGSLSKFVVRAAGSLGRRLRRGATPELAGLARELCVPARPPAAAPTAGGEGAGLGTGMQGAPSSGETSGCPGLRQRP